MSKRRHPRPGPGRPGADEGRNRRDQILSAARTLFSREGFDGVSIRRIAGEAGVNSALVAYYFGDKQGLYEALLEEAMGPLLATLEEIGDEPPAAEALKGLMTRYMETLAEHDWIPPLLVREVLSEKGPFRQRFIERFAGRGAPRLARVLMRARAAGLIRDDLDPALTALSLVSLMLFPFIGRPVASQVLGLSFDEAQVTRLAEHQFHLFMQGAAPRSQP